jgi:putative flavoprotein involved in K+ transport
MTPYSPNDLEGPVRDWIADFAAHLESMDELSLSALFDPGADWRDIVALTWSIATTYGPEQIAAELIRWNEQTGAQAFGLDASRTPPRRILRAGDDVIEAIFSFRTAAGRGAGVVRLVRRDAGAPRAVAFLTTLEELDAFPERRGARRPHGTAFSRTFGGENWADLRRAAREYEDREPEVLVVGAGQTGLAIAARLGTIGVDVLVIDALPAVGDVWRRRYHSLTLHNESWVASMPYMEYPDTWPTYLPKDKLAGWLEYYAEAMELNVWTSSRLVGGDFDEDSRQWTITVDRDGTPRTLRPQHVVICTGSVSGIPNLPSLPGLDSFRGDVIHSSSYTSGSEYEGRKAMVIGTGTSGHDVAQDLHALGSDAWIVQRNPTTVVSLEPSGVMVYRLYSEGLPLDDADLISAASSYQAMIRANQVMAQKMVEADAELLDRLHAVGFRTDLGEDQTGFHLKYNRRGGGYYINVGCSELIADGEITLLQYEQIATFAPEGAVLADGTLIPLDLVVLATGYRNQQEDVRRWFGPEIADRVGPIWGVDEDGEMRNVWRPTAQPGLWFHSGSLAASRIYSKYLAMLIIADMRGVSPKRLTIGAHA